MQIGGFRATDRRDESLLDVIGELLTAVAVAGLVLVVRGCAVAAAEAVEKGGQKRGECGHDAVDQAAD